MLLPFDYIGYKRLSENKRFPNHRWYSDATWGNWVKTSLTSPLCIIAILFIFPLMFKTDTFHIT
jgi:hypothetical protein